MLNVTCPNCELENAYVEVAEIKGPLYYCRDCGFEWSDKSKAVEEEEKEDEDEEEEEPDLEEDDDDVFHQSLHYTTDAIQGFLKKVIQNFDDYNIKADDLVVIAKIHMIVGNLKNYNVEGYLHFTVKEIIDPEDMKYQEIQIDGDGLSLTTGGYVTGDFGGDPYSTIIFPSNDEGEALNTISDIDNFISDFEEKLSDQLTVIVAFDSGDPVEENE